MLVVALLLVAIPVLAFFGTFFVGCLRDERLQMRVTVMRFAAEQERPARAQRLRLQRVLPFPVDPAAAHRRATRLVVAALLLTSISLRGQTSDPQGPATTASAVPWQYGGFVDLGYLHDFNDPANHLFRNRGTTPRVNEWDVNMAAVYLRKAATAGSRWGIELTLQAGKDSEAFGFSATAPNLAGAKWLRHLGPTDVSYLAPIGKGLTIQGGIFSSLIGYDGLYAKDNFNYTRPWGADYTPYLMLGVNASYPFTARLTSTFFVVNGYFHLADANGVPSTGAQLAYKASERVTLKQTFMYGPHQSDTALEFWRFLSDSIAEWKGKQVTTALECHVGTEKVAAPGNPRALFMAAQLPARWAIARHWSATVRPEFYWDRDGRLTGFRQHVKALTGTLEYHVPYRRTNTIVRLEYRFDDSRGPGGGFFRAGTVPGLTPTQHLLGVGLIFTLDAQAYP